MDFNKTRPMCTGLQQDTTDVYWTLTRHDWRELDFNKTQDRCVPEFNKIRPMCKYFNKTRLMYTRQDWCVLDLN